MLQVVLKRFERVDCGTTVVFRHACSVDELSTLNICVLWLQEIQAIDNAMKKMKFGQGVGRVSTLSSLPYVVVKYEL